MAEVEYATSARLPVETIWDYVRDMDNWAEHLTGYQSHEKESDDDSVWVLKGDLGSLTRTLKFRVHVTEWAGPERVTFELTGLNEQMSGQGEFRMTRFEQPGSALAAAPAKKSLFARLLESIARFFFRRRHGTADRGAGADAGPGEGMAKLAFRLRVDPAGPMAPMINAMVTPAMQVAAEDLANNIVARLEAQRDS